MRLTADALNKQLSQELLPVYLVSGAEQLLVQEACDAIRNACRQRGFDERQVFHAERSFDWNQLREAAASMSLFADKRVLDLRMPTGKPGDKGAQFLQEYVAKPAPDNLLLISCDKLDSSTMRSKWAKALQDSKNCGFVQIADVSAHQLPSWLRQRLAAQGLSADDEVLQLISERVEGNLLAAAQEIEKLRLLTVSDHLDFDSVQNAIADSARYDAFTWVDAAIAGERERSLRILNGLRGEGQEIPMLLWVLAKDLRQLSVMASKMQQGQSPAQLVSKVWPATRKPILQKALSRHPAGHWQKLLQQAQLIDAQAKGQEAGNAWLTLQQLLMQL